MTINVILCKNLHECQLLLQKAKGSEHRILLQRVRAGERNCPYDGERHQCAKNSAPGERGAIQVSCGGASAPHFEAVPVAGAAVSPRCVAAALEIGPIAFFGGAAALAGADYALVANNVEIPFVGLSAGFYLGLLLVPLAGVLAVVGVALASLKK